MREQSILCEGWTVSRTAGGERSKAVMPAQVHDVLFENGEIPDPRIGRNAAESAWIGDEDWEYRTSFPTPDGSGPAFLRFLGLDTIAEIVLNGTEIGRTANMHRHFAFEVRDLLVPNGENDLRITFRSPTRTIEEMRSAGRLAQGITENHYLRKCKSDFSSYLGARPHAIKMGIFDDVMLDVPDESWIDGIHTTTGLTDELDSGNIRCTVKLAGAAATLFWALAAPDGQHVAEGKIDGAAGSAGFEAVVEHPVIWQPHTEGDPALYSLEVHLGSNGVLLDRRTVDVGFRTIRPVLEDPVTGEQRFAFEVNGRRLFLRGANWAPLEGISHRWDHAKAVRLLDMAVECGMNLLRVWGGGTIPPEAFYHECDRRGILVWQDFMFGYARHPEDDPEFITECAAEAEEMVVRLRNHPCICMWCGGNENHMGWNFQTREVPADPWPLFQRLLPETCAQLDPGRFYHPSSPFGGPLPNWPLEGDWHDYTTLTHIPGSSVPLFVSEIGRASTPVIGSMRRFMSPEELWPEGYDPRITEPGAAAWPPMWQYRSVDGSWDKVGPIIEFCDPVSAEDLARIIGTAHGEYLQRRIERQRRGVPDGTGIIGEVNRRCWGNMVWRLNDPWPIIYWSVIDYYLVPKIAYWFLKRAYCPLLISFEVTDDVLRLWVTNDGTSAEPGTMNCRVRKLTGEVLESVDVPFRATPGASICVLDLSPVGPVNLREQYLEALFGDHLATRLLTGERNLRLPKAELSLHREADTLLLSSNTFARQVVLCDPANPETRFSDNYFDLPPGQIRRIGILGPASGEITASAFNAAVTRVAR